MNFTEIGRQIAADSLRADVLNDFDRTIAGPPVVQVRIPLRDPAELKRHLLILSGVVSDALAMIDQSGRKDRSVLLDVRGRFRAANQKINAYRQIRQV